MKQTQAPHRIYAYDEPLPKGTEWAIVKINVPRKGKGGKKLKPLLVYVARDEEAARKYGRPRGHAKYPDGRAVFTRMEMAQILDTCEKFPRKQWRKVMLDCIRTATDFKLVFGAARVDRVMSNEEAAEHRKRNVPIDPKDMEPVSYAPRDTSKKKKPVKKRLPPDTSTRAMPWN